ncbi:VC0807 family protein [uncultured Nocardioides sp.]|uniref:VC0807 family protein n=1 Tax=uncultured Nocardioides sp. TaxID=198441 RepID=UPI002636550E|nr:VC0807 family protein [uncultured Nocardioides sp.]
MSREESGRPGWVGTLLGVGQNVVLPIAAYLVLVGLGWAPVWALAGSAAVSVVVLGVEWRRTRRVDALGGLVLLRFVLSLALAWLTGDARVLLVKDSAITAVIALVGLASLRWERPAVARIRADLSGDREAFDAELARRGDLRALHRRLTVVWAVGLLAEAATSTTVALLAPITVAVVVTNLTGPAVIVGLVALTELRARRHRAPAEA